MNALWQFILSFFRPAQPWPVPTPAPLPEPTPNAILDEINRQRVAKNLKPFLESACLNGQAQGWAAEMERRGRISHNGFAGRLSHCGMNGGEIVAWGQRSAAEVVDDWMHSPGHRARILSRNTYCGTGFSGVCWCALDGTPGQSGLSAEDAEAAEEVLDHVFGWNGEVA